jgi:caa(3)-type oxidase subunit IV
MADHQGQTPHEQGQHHHVILSEKKGVMIWGALLVLTIITVWSAQYDLGMLDVPLAMLIATGKASLVFLFFMGLLYDKGENRIIFGGSVLFVTIFVVLTSFDIFFRRADEGRVGTDPFFSPAAAMAGQFEQPWISRPELVEVGKRVYATQCAACHGIEGRGDGPAAGGLVPRPRNLHTIEGWLNGPKVTEIYRTLSEGVGGMPAFTNLSIDERWGVSHYTVAFGPEREEVTPADLAEIGWDPEGVAPVNGDEKIPVGLAIEILSEEAN